MTGRTRMPETRLVELRAEGMSRRGRFVDPVVIRKCEVVLDRRGEIWAASILGRDLARRSALFPRRPWLRDGEEYVLVLADAAEDRYALEAS